MSTKKIVSNLAQYKNGQLTCIVCNLPVKSELYWTGHVNGRVHRDNINLLKRKAEPQTSSQQQQKRSRVDSNVDQVKSVPTKTPADIPSNDRIIFKVPQDRNVPTVEPGPSLDKVKSSKESDNNFHSNGTYLKKYESPQVPQQQQQQQSVEEDDNKSKKESSSLPEGFFDDPKLDAKVRGVEFVDPEDAEWDKFVKEIASEELQSESILVVDEEESRKERELDEIEEMMGHWQKVIDLERKKETRVKKMETNREDEESSDEDEDFGEELDWRAKKLKKF